MKIAIIPARKGSKRLINKNIKSLNGKPLIAWTIEAAKQSGYFRHVFVSTDCEKIAYISKQYGAEVPFLRDSALATDTATTSSVVSHFISQLIENKIVLNLDTVALLQPTSPLRESRHIASAFEQMRSLNADAIVSVCEVDHPPELSNTLDVTLSMDGFIKKENLKRSQDYQKNYRLNGAIYLFNDRYFHRPYLYEENTFAFVMDRSSSVDIDTAEDFMFAEVLLNRNN